jgi:hypothetical protein
MTQPITDAERRTLGLPPRAITFTAQCPECKQDTEWTATRGNEMAVGDDVQRVIYDIPQCVVLAAA